MLHRRWFMFLATAVVFGQEAVPFTEEVSNPWKPSWELTLRGDKLSDPGEPSDRFSRASLQLRLRWTWDYQTLRGVFGVRSAMGSDGNQFNSPRWDQQPSNGSQVDMAHLGGTWVSERAFASLQLGFQENGLMAPQALWDRNLRLLGAGGMAGFRGADGQLQEASVRAITGRIRNVLGGRGDLTAGQLVFKVDTGPWSWTAHAGRWQLAWDPGEERLRHLPGHSPTERQKMVVDAGGLAAKWNTVLPLEARWFQSVNRDTKETSEEAQVTVGSRERLYWPQVSFTWQRLSSTGTLYPVNGDEWWFYRRAEGPRFDLSVPLPGKWLGTFVYLRQESGGETYHVTRKMLVLVKRF